MRVDRDTAAGGGLGESTAHREQRGLRHAVVDHLGGNGHRRIAGEVEDPSPAAVLHPGQVGADEPDGGEHVDLEVAAPLLVVDLQRGSGPEDAEVVDEDVDGGHGIDDCGGAVRGRQVAHRSDDGFATGFRARRADRCIDSLLTAAVEDDARTRAGETGRDG